MGKVNKSLRVFSKQDHLHGAAGSQEERKEKVPVKPTTKYWSRKKASGQNGDA